MKKNDVFTFTAPNGVEVTGIVIMKCGDAHEKDYGHYETPYLCYSQNRLFTIKEVMKAIRDDFDIKRGTAGAESLSYEYGEIIVEYCVLPDYDEILAPSLPVKASSPIELASLTLDELNVYKKTGNLPERLRNARVI